MSSLPDGGPVTTPKRVPGWKKPWDRGRILMVAGCLTLLTLSIAQGITHFGLPRWFDIAVRVIGYLLMAVGFRFTMRLKRERRLAAVKPAEAEEGASPRVPG